MELSLSSVFSGKVGRRLRRGKGQDFRQKGGASGYNHANGESFAGAYAATVHWRAAITSTTGELSAVESLSIPVPHKVPFRQGASGSSRPFSWCASSR
ncbi:hypothetical protein ACFSQE_02140 [Vogesella fluminis]|uniref:hypothetical protein n=1 Tax=Vogesella fluminis TaxID=1069161 RepID=UPI00364204EF